MAKNRVCQLYVNGKTYHFTDVQELDAFLTKLKERKIRTNIISLHVERAYARSNQERVLLSDRIIVLKRKLRDAGLEV